MGYLILLEGQVFFAFMQIINKLTAEELKKILKVNIIRPRVFVMKPGDVMFITGLARIDYLEVSLLYYVKAWTFLAEGFVIDSRIFSILKQTY